MRRQRGDVVAATDSRPGGDGGAKRSVVCLPGTA